MPIYRLKLIFQIFLIGIKLLKADNIAIEGDSNQATKSHLNKLLMPNSQDTKHFKPIWIKEPYWIILNKNIFKSFINNIT